MNILDDYCDIDIEEPKKAYECIDCKKTVYGSHVIFCGLCKAPICQNCIEDQKRKGN